MMIKLVVHIAVFALWAVFVRSENGIFTANDLEKVINEVKNGNTNNVLFAALEQIARQQQQSEDDNQIDHQKDENVLRKLGSLVTSFIPDRIGRIFKSIDENFLNTKQTLETLKEYMAKYNKQYNVTELPRRFKILMDNMKIIQQSMQDYALGKSTFEMGVNEFSDFDDKEIDLMKGKKILERMNDVNGNNEIDSDSFGLKNKKMRSYTRSTSSSSSKIKAKNLPEALDYRLTGCMNNVRDQGSCGSCYAFSTLSIIESLICLQNGQKVKLSPQQIIDCGRDEVNDGCQGGDESNVIDYLNKRGYISLEKYYPYTGKDDSFECKRSAGIVKASIDGKGGPIKYKVIQGEGEIMYHLAKYGPIAAGLQAENKHFAMYKRGIYANSLCTRPANARNQDHAVVLAGYGKEDGHKYWLIKNSWGTIWGEKGYMKLKRGSNECSIESRAYALLGKELI